MYLAAWQAAGCWLLAGSSPCLLYSASEDRLAGNQRTELVRIKGSAGARRIEAKRYNASFCVVRCCRLVFYGIALIALDFAIS